MKSRISKKSAGILWSILITLSLAIAGLYMPVFFFMSYLPVVLIILRYGYRAGFTVLAMLSLTLLFVQGDMLGLQQDIPFVYAYLLVFGSLAIGMSVFIKQGFTASRIIGMSTMLFVVLFSLLLVTANPLFRADPAREFRKRQDNDNRQRLELIENKLMTVPDADDESKQELINMLMSVSALSRRLTGTVFAFLSFVCIGLSYILARRVFPGYGIRLMKLPKFSDWRPGERMVWGLILGGVLYFWGTYSKTQAVNTIGLNVGLFFLVVYFISGLSITSSVLNRFKVPVITRILIYVLFLLQYPFLAGIGIADVWFDFRRKLELRAKKKKGTV